MMKKYLLVTVLGMALVSSCSVTTSANSSENTSNSIASESTSSGNSDSKKFNFDYGNDDFKEFLKTLEKCRKHYQTDCINMQNPSQIRLVMQHFSVPDGTNVQNSNFKINDCDIMLTERKALPLFTFIAKLTRIIAFAKGPSEAYKNCAKFVNAAAHNEAMNFIENLM